MYPVASIQLRLWYSAVVRHARLIGGVGHQLRPSPLQLGAAFQENFVLIHGCLLRTIDDGYSMPEKTYYHNTFVGRVPDTKGLLRI